MVSMIKIGHQVAELLVTIWAGDKSRGGASEQKWTFVKVDMFVNMSTLTPLLKAFMGTLIIHFTIIGLNMNSSYIMFWLVSKVAIRVLKLLQENYE